MKSTPIDRVRVKPAGCSTGDFTTPGYPPLRTIVRRLRARLPLVLDRRRLNLDVPLEVHGEDPKKLPCGFWVGDRGPHPHRPRRSQGTRRHLTSPRAAHGQLGRRAQSPLATPIPQGNEPTLPHKASADPTEQELFSRCQSGTGSSGVVRVTGHRGQVRSVSPDALDSTILSPCRSNISGRFRTERTRPRSKSVRALRSRVRAGRVPGRLAFATARIARFHLWLR